jgi:Protein of unknown function (Hypoth_ymh)
MLLHEFQVNLDRTSADYRKLGMAVLRADIKALEATRERSAGEWTDTPPPVPIARQDPGSGEGLRAAMEGWKKERKRSPRTLTEYRCMFSPKAPVLRFNEMRDESDTNERPGFMMMFSGAVAGLRNPRAHSLIKDDPERALDFIAYVSLLAKAP